MPKAMTMPFEKMLQRLLEFCLFEINEEMVSAKCVYVTMSRLDRIVMVPIQRFSLIFQIERERCNSGYSGALSERYTTAVGREYIIIQDVQLPFRFAKQIPATRASIVEKPNKRGESHQVNLVSFQEEEPQWLRKLYSPTLRIEPETFQRRRQ